MTNRRLAVVLGVAAFVAASVLMAPASSGQSWCGGFLQPKCPTTTTTTTTAPSTTTTTTTTTSTTTTAPDNGGGGDGGGDGGTGGGSSSTTQPPTSAPDGSPSSTVPAGEEPGGENPDGTGDAQPGVVPPDAQSIINSVVRSAPNSSTELLAAIEPLVEMGLPRDEAIRISFGAFPVAGDSNFVHDWLFPRYGPGFRFHKGTDIFAAYGTPLRAVSDGIVRATNNGLGGLAVRVVQPDGTYFYYAHLSALVDGYEEGMSVETGDIIGYVGDSGNARGGSPHLHFGIYRGGTALDPKPFLDQALADATENLPNVIEQVRASLEAGDGVGFSARRPRSLLATSLLRERTDMTVAGAVSTETLYQTSGNPPAGGVAVVEHEAGRLASVIDWSTRLLEPITDPDS